MKTFHTSLLICVTILAGSHQLSAMNNEKTPHELYMAGLRTKFIGAMTAKLALHPRVTTTETGWKGDIITVLEAQEEVLMQYPYLKAFTDSRQTKKKE